MTTRPSTTTRPEMIRLQTAHARGSTSSAMTLRRHQIILQRHVVESQRCSSTPAHVHLQPNYYRLRRRRARRQILSSLMEQRCDAPLFEVVQVATYDFCNASISLRSGDILGEGECLINFRRSRKKREEKNAKK